MDFHREWVLDFIVFANLFLYGFYLKKMFYFLYVYERRHFFLNPVFGGVRRLPLNLIPADKRMGGYLYILYQNTLLMTPYDF